MRKRKAFTLVELLVVIGIIAVLISILLPALKRVKEQANAVKCMANQKQIMTALMMYTGENRGALPIPPRIDDTYANCSSAPYDTPNNIIRHSVMYYTVEMGVLDYTEGPFWKYLGRAATSTTSGNQLEAVMNCPSDDKSFRAVYRGALQIDAGQKRNFCYSWNLLMRSSPNDSDNPNHPDAAHKIGQIKRAAHKILLLEELAPNDGACYIAANPHNADDEPASRHNGAGAFGFADGHVETLTPMDLGFARTTGLLHTQIESWPRVRSYFMLKDE